MERKKIKQFKYRSMFDFAFDIFKVALIAIVGYMTIFHLVELV